MLHFLLLILCNELSELRVIIVLNKSETFPERYEFIFHANYLIIQNFPIEILNLETCKDFIVLRIITECEIQVYYNLK